MENPSSSSSGVQPADPRATHFEVLGVPAAFDVDLGQLERRYKELSRKWHPDRFTRADAQDRRAALGRSVQLNQAWKTLRDPVRRAEYLLSLGGIDVGTEEGTLIHPKRADALGDPGRRATDGTKQKLPVPQELLLEVMELREGLHEAHTAGDTGRVAALAADVTGRKQTAMAAVARALGASPAELEAAARELVAVRYYDRFLDEVEAKEDEGSADGRGDGNG